ncbi:hypothetical protein WJX72_005380 [[Myrmecia] bisecta]|uniref:Pre-rRNA-processing protein IPI1 n=1 Tax=[Myrmecia] bisecta TaxID=41462 RepID=A0AAW1PJ15_9CHLO
MPKSKPPKGTKRKNAGVGVDFRRVKHKVGKKLAPAQNATDTNFKARSITLPGQSVTEDKQGAAVNQRNLTLKELLGQVGHYSEKVRKEALLGLVDLLKKHPKELKRHTGPVLEKLAERITDVDKAVREALRGLLAGAVLPLLAGGAIVPFLPLLVAHVSSAMTHLANDVRADALGFLEVLMMAAPQQLSSTFLTPALQHYADLLSSASRGRSVSARSLASLLKVVTSLRSFLGECAPGQLADIPELTATQCMEAILQCANLLLDQMGQAGTPAHKRAWEASILRKGYGVAGAAGGGSSQEAEWVGRLLDYYVGIMEHGQVLPSRGGLTHETTQSSIPGDVYTVVLAGVKQALPSVSPARRSALLGATAALAQRSGARSPVRTACLKFQHALLASPEATFYPHPVTGAVLMTEEQAAGWVEAMPRLLWELGSSRPESSRLALRLLLDAGRYASPNGAISQTLTSLQPQLAPFFCSLLPVAAAAAASKKAQKGGSKGQQSGTLPAKAGGKADKVFTPGPLAKLPADCQTLAVDLLYFLPSISEVTLRTVALLALSSSYPIALATRAVAIVARRGNDADPAQFLSWLLTLLVGRSAHLPADGDWRRHTAVVEAACHAMQTYGKPGEVLQLLAPALVQLCTDSGDRRAWFVASPATINGRGTFLGDAGTFRGNATCIGTGVFTANETFGATLYGNGRLTGSGQFKVASGTFEGLGQFEGKNVACLGNGTLEGSPGAMAGGRGWFSGTGLQCNGFGSLKGMGSCDSLGGTMMGSGLLTGQGAMHGTGAFIGQGNCTGGTVLRLQQSNAALRALLNPKHADSAFHDMMQNQDAAKD